MPEVVLKPAALDMFNLDTSGPECAALLADGHELVFYASGRRPVLSGHFPLKDENPSSRKPRAITHTCIEIATEGNLGLEMLRLNCLEAIAAMDAETLKLEKRAATETAALPEPGSYVVLRETGDSIWMDGAGEQPLFADTDGRRIWGMAGGHTPAGDPWMLIADYQKALTDYHAWGLPRMARILEALRESENGDALPLQWGSILPEAGGLSILRTRGLPTGLEKGEGPPVGYFRVRLDEAERLATVSPSPPVAGLPTAGPETEQPVAAMPRIDVSDTDAGIAGKIRAAIPKEWHFVPDPENPSRLWIGKSDLILRLDNSVEEIEHDFESPRGMTC